MSSGRHVFRVAFSPLEQCFEHRAQFAALRGQHVFGTGRVLFVKMALDNTSGFEPLKSRRQGIGADPGQGARELMELARSEADQVAQNEDRPTLSNDVEGAGNGALI